MIAHQTLVGCISYLVLTLVVACHNNVSLVPNNVVVHVQVLARSHVFVVDSILTCMIAHQTLVGNLIPCLDPSWSMHNLVTHETLVGACESIGDLMCL